MLKLRFVYTSLSIMENFKTYKPIDCHFYDMLEAAAVKRQYVDIVYDKGQGEQSLRAFIDDLRAEHGEEFMYLHNGLKIRLDHIIKVEGNFNPSVDMDQISCMCH